MGREESFLFSLFFFSFFLIFPFLSLLANGDCDWIMEATVFGPSSPPFFEKLCYVGSLIEFSDFVSIFHISINAKFSEGPD